MLPRYQRSYVWSVSKRQELVDSLLRGFPIGTLIVRKLPTKAQLGLAAGGFVEADSFEILDGLQRATTLILHQLHPFGLVGSTFVAECLEASNLTARQISESLEVEGVKADVSPDLILTALSNWLKSCARDQEFREGNFDTSATYLVSAFEEDKFDTSLMLDFVAESISATEKPAIIQSFLDAGFSRGLTAFRNTVKNRLDISNVQIPVLVWEGPSEGAALIFERVNQGGVKLNRYQVLAASWSNSLTDISSGEVHDAARKALMPATGSVVVQKQPASDTNLDLYEALIGLSEILASKFPHLFQKAKFSKRATARSVLEQSKSVYYAFNILALVLGVKLTDLESVSSKLNHIPDSQRLAVEKIVSAILTAAAHVSQALVSLTYAPDEHITSAHKESAMASLVARLSRHVLDGGEVEEVNTRTIRRHYLLDLLSEFSKSHATDQEAFDRVWVKSGESLVLNPYYLRDPGEDALNDALSEFWETQKTKKITLALNKRPRIDPLQKTIMRLYAGPRASHVAIKGVELHLDHVVPYMRVQKWMEKNGPDEIYAVGAVSNLAFIPKKMNLSKGKETIDEWLGETKKTSVKTELLTSMTRDQIWTLVPAQQGEIDLWITGQESADPTSASFNKLQQQIWARMSRSLIE